MPSPTHDGLTSLFRSRPELVAELLPRSFGATLPVYESVRAGPAELPDLVPTEYRADVVVVLDRGDEPVLAVVVEVQLRRDRDKRWSWPVYVTTLRARLQCPVELLVVCPDARVATWCAAPIRLGAESHLTPLVLGPDLVPVVTDVDEAARLPELAVLSAVAHGGGRDRGGVLPVLPRALEKVETEQRHLYLELVYTALPQTARRHLEEIMLAWVDQEYADREVGPYGQWLMSRGEAKGKAVGEARAVLAFLEARGMTVSEGQRTSIVECTDLDQLDVWVRRAANATSVEDLFD